MPDYEAAITVKADVDVVFSYLSDVQNLPEYFERMTSARSGEGETLIVTANVHGHQEHGEAWFNVDDEAKVLTWGSEGPNNYQGRLRVEAHQAGDASTVSVALTTERVATDEIQQGLEQTLSNVQRLLQTQ